MSYGRVFVLFALNEGFLSFIEIICSELGAPWARQKISRAGQISTSRVLSWIADSWDARRLFPLSPVALEIPLLS